VGGEKGGGDDNGGGSEDDGGGDEVDDGGGDYDDWDIGLSLLWFNIFTNASFMNKSSTDYLHLEHQGN